MFPVTVWRASNAGGRMAKTGRRFKFHGAFSSKIEAIKKERKVHGFIRPANIRGHRRYVVMTERTR